MRNQYSKLISRPLCIVSVLLSVICFSPHLIQSVHGAPGTTFTFTVDRTDDVIIYSGCDDGVNDDDCSLRGVLGLIPGLSSDNYVINIPDGVYILDISANPVSENSNIEGDLDFPAANITLQGESMAGTIIDGNGTDRVLDTLGTYLTLNDLTIRNGRIEKTEGGGGGIRVLAGSLSLNRVTVSGNVVEGVHMENGSRGGGIGEGAAAPITINDSTITNNQAVLGGGIDHQYSSTFSMTDSILNSNSSVDAGGAMTIWGGTNMIERCSIIGNHSDVAAGISVSSVTSLAISDSLFESNVALSLGGGMAISGPTTLTNVTFHENSGPYGGGGLMVGSATVNLVNVTLVANHAHTAGGGLGGGIRVDYDGFAILDHVTLAGNTANEGNAVYMRYGNLTAISSILSDGTGDACAYINGGSLTTNGFNLGSDASCSLGAGDLVNQDLHFGAFGYFGGLTPTQQILTGSPAINFGNPADALDRLDQRGIPIIGGRSDSGAFEFIPPSLWLPLINKP
jgi:hypothetical protein